MPTPPKWKYGRRSPNPNKLEQDIVYRPGHVYGLITRRNMMEANTIIQKRVYCSCGWKDDTWILSRRAISLIFNRHIELVSKQGSLF